MIDLKHEARNFAPMDLPVADSNGENDDMIRAYSLYNKTLSHIRRGYDDLARQHLKRALLLCPDCYPARMLLGVCLFANGDRVGAMRMFNGIKDTQYRRLALSYYDYLTEEVDKPASESASRLILKDLYRATAASNSTLSDVTKSPPAVEKAEAEYYPDAPEEEPVRPREPDGIEIPKFFAEKQQTLITSRKNDGVVEEIVKQKVEAAQKAAKYSGHEKKPFAYDSMYRKKVFSQEEDVSEASSEDAPKSGRVREPMGKDNIVLSVASVVILLFIVIVSVSLMSKITENRKLKNELDDLKKLYAQTQITPAPGEDSGGSREPVWLDPDRTPFSTSDPTPHPTETPIPTATPAATPAATPGGDLNDE